MPRLREVMLALPRFVLLPAVYMLAMHCLPAHAFGRIDCFEAPAAHRPVAALIGQINMELAFYRPAETRACAYYARGLLYHFDGQTGRAIADYTSAIAWMHGFGDALAARGDAYEDIGEHALAEADYARAKELSGESAEELMERCWIRGLRGRPLSRALEDCNASLKLEAGNFDALSSRCLVYERIGNATAAIADCNAALAQKPQNPTALFVKGLAELKAGDAQTGNADIATAKRLGDSVEETFALYGIAPQKSVTATVSPPP